MTKDQVEYKTDSASLFHAAAAQVPPIPCQNGRCLQCGKLTAEFSRDYDKYEIYKCTCCHIERWIAVR